MARCSDVCIYSFVLGSLIEWRVRVRTGVMTTSKAPAASSTVPLLPPALLPPCLCSFTWCAQPSRLSDIARPAKRRARKFLLTGSQVAAPAGCTCSHTMSDKVIFGLPHCMASARAGHQAGQQHNLHVVAFRVVEILGCVDYTRCLRYASIGSRWRCDTQRQARSSWIKIKL